MKPSLLLIFCLLVFSIAKGQVNYVLNPSLEIYDTCPYLWDQIHFAKYWNSIDTLRLYVMQSDGEPDYCNICAGANAQVGVPQNGSFYHYPRTGNGMAQVETYFDESISDPYRRDYLQGKLYKPLVGGKSYCVSFYVTLEQSSRYAVNNIGAYLDDGTIDTTHKPGDIRTQYYPQILETAVIIDTPNWVKIEGSFTANGTEKFITIGNFIANTTAIPYDPGHHFFYWSWHLVDDVSVIESDTKAYAFNHDTLHKGYMDSFLLGRDEIIPGIKWWRDGVLIDTLNAGLWIHDNVLGTYHTYVLSQTLCGITTWDTVVVSVEAVSSEVGNLQFAVGNLKVWPNPVGDELHVETSPGLSKGELTVYIMSVDGRTLMRKEAAKSIDISALAKGLYLIKVFDKNDVLISTMKFVKASN